MRKKIVIFLVVASIIAISVPFEYAFMYKKTQMIENEFVPAQVSCEIQEAFKKVEGGSEKSSVKVKNTSNIPVYIRVIVMTYWQDSKGNILTDTDELTPLPTIQLNDNYWIHYGDNIYYYKTQIDPEETTENFLKANTTIKLVDAKENHEGVIYEKQQVVEIVAEAIQAKPLNVVQECWGITFAPDGQTITNK